MSSAFSAAGLLLIATVPLLAQGRNYGRSMVISQQGIAATSQPEALSMRLLYTL